MKDIAIYGAGGLGREVAAVLDYMLDENESWRLVGFFDDGIPEGTEIGSFGKVLGGMDALNLWKTPLAVALCFGDGRITRIVHSKITNPSVSFPNLISHSFCITDPLTFKIGIGNIIHGGCVATTNIQIGDFNLLNGDVTFGHDVHVGSYNTFMPGCRISGEVTIGNGCLFGAMSFVKQLLHIGDNVRLSPLSPLLKNPEDNCLYVGNPAKKFKF
ncbi:MAG: serine acetyltransferase [Muribaculaceae bacterium]|nr:serine acetyltransferase [Muribaculaceae bacterium]